MTSLSSLEGGIRLHLISTDLETTGWVLWGWEIHSMHNLFLIHQKQEQHTLQALESQHFVIVDCEYPLSHVYSSV